MSIVARFRRVTENEHWLWARGLMHAPLGCRGQCGLCHNRIKFIVMHPKRRDYWCESCLPSKYLATETKR